MLRIFLDSDPSRSIIIIIVIIVIIIIREASVLQQDNEPKPNAVMENGEGSCSGRSGPRRTQTPGSLSQSGVS